jgi:Flp pilus assembly pilin Flp
MPSEKINRHLSLPSNNGQPLIYRFQILRNQWGGASIEYALLSALIAMVILTGIGNAGAALFDLWTSIAAQVSAAIG